MLRWKLLLAPLLGLASLQAMACYTVYDRTNRILYQGENAPVDMSRPLHETLPARFPAGAQLIFDTSAECTVINTVALGNGSPVTRTQSPLLTDERTARRLGVPHRNLGYNIAMVPPAAVAMEPGVTVVPAVTDSATAIALGRRGQDVVVSDNR